AQTSPRKVDPPPQKHPPPIATQHSARENGKPPILFTGETIQGLSALIEKP
ncbi:hypothetical protein DIPPA_20110, partial [Diplonema papillatum]